MKILGTNDAVNSCDCCGKSGLKFTVTVDFDGEILHYGSTCATKHTKMSTGAINKAIKDKTEAVRNSVKKEFESTMEYLRHAAKLMQLNRDKVKPGKDFLRAQKESCDIADMKKREIAKKFGLAVYEF